MSKLSKRTINGRLNALLVINTILIVKDAALISKKGENTQHLSILKEVGNGGGQNFRINLNHKLSTISDLTLYNENLGTHTIATFAKVDFYYLYRKIRAKEDFGEK